MSRIQPRFVFVLLVLASVSTDTTAYAKEFLRKMQSNGSAETQCLDNTSSFLSTSQTLMAARSEYVSSRMEMSMEPEMPESDESSMIVEFPSTSVKAFEQACDDEGGMFLHEDDMALTCQTQAGADISVTFVNAASCVSDIDDCKGIDMVKSFDAILAELNMACEAQSGTGPAGVRMTDTEDEDEASIDDNTEEDNTDIDKISDDEANEADSGGDDESMDSDSDSDSLSDSKDSSLDEEGVAMATTSSAAFSSVGKKAGPTLGTLLLGLLCCGGIWFVVQRFRRPKPESSTNRDAKEVESTNTEEDMA